METQFETDLKVRMGYKPTQISCKTCRYFVPTDISGSMQAKNQHCTLNPAVDLPVQEHGRCKFHTPKVEAASPP